MRVTGKRPDCVAIVIAAVTSNQNKAPAQPQDSQSTLFGGK